MTETEKSHPFPDRIIVSGPANEYPTELLEARCELTILQKGSTFEVLEVEGEMFSDSRPATREEIAASVELSPAMAHGLALDCEVANPRFEIGDKIVPGPESTLCPHPEGTGEVVGRFYCRGCRGWHYLVSFPTTHSVQMLEDRMVQMLEDRMVPVEHEGWQGTPPAEGTRRALIFDAICGAVRKRIAEKGRHDPFGERDEELALWLTDAIEEAFLAQERGEEASTEPLESRDQRAPRLTDEPGHFAQEQPDDQQLDEQLDAARLFASVASFFGGRR